MTYDTEIIAIGLRMVVAGVPFDFVGRVVAVAHESRGVADMLRVWDAHVDDRDEAVVAMHEVLEDRDPACKHVVVTTTADGSRIAEERKAFKANLRRLVEEQGGVSRVAELSGIPQPSLSRLLNSLSEPRSSTLHCLAGALGCSVEALSDEPEEGPDVPAKITRIDRYSPSLKAALQHAPRASRRGDKRPLGPRAGRGAR